LCESINKDRLGGDGVGVTWLVVGGIGVGIGNRSLGMSQFMKIGKVRLNAGFLLLCILRHPNSHLENISCYVPLCNSAVKT
jgi:hypothetical protein